MSAIIPRTLRRLGAAGLIIAGMLGAAAAAEATAAAPALLPAVTRSGGDLLREGRPFGFVGINYSISLQDTRRDDPERLVERLDRWAAWRVGVIRLPLTTALMQVEPGVFPDHPRWSAVMEAHRLNPRWWERVEWFVAEAARRGMYTVLDLHGFPTDPHSYFAGGNPADKATGTPGTAIAWLARPGSTYGSIIPDDPEHRAFLLATHAWLARRFRGNSNILAIEVPWNEPHDRWSGVPENWARLASACALAVKREDPDRLVWAMPASWGHDNLSWRATWSLPEGVDASAPHYYISNGPIPQRPDAKQGGMRSWCRLDVPMTFALTMRSVLFPMSGGGFPLAIGEGGDVGWEQLLDGTAGEEASAAMVEATLAQGWMGGLSGNLLWVMWTPGAATRFFPAVYGPALQRFAPVYADPVRRGSPAVIIAQNPGAVPPSNGLNHACVPLVRAMLDLHLQSAAYMSDQQLLNTVLSRTSAGLEQAGMEAVWTGGRAVVADPRGFDPQARAMLEKGALPVLWLADPASPDAADLERFLAAAGIPSDRQTPATLQYAAADRHLVVFNADRQAWQGRIHPLVPWEGRFQLRDETGASVFTGSAAELRRDGLPLACPGWRSAILARAAAP